MAKKKGKFSKKIMPPKEVTVKSRAYGIHTRAARGSKTPVAINDAFKEHVAKTVVINSVAKRVHDLLKRCGESFKEPMLWQVMLSRMRAAASDDVTQLLMTLKGMELNKKYPLGRFILPLRLRSEKNKKKIVVRLYDSIPLCKGQDTQYRYELCFLLLGNETTDDALFISGSEWMNFDHKEGEIVFESKMPGNIQYFLLCLHFMSGNDGKASCTLASRGMQIVEVERFMQE